MIADNLRTLAKELSMETTQQMNVPLIKQAADALALLEGATVVEVSCSHDCPLRDSSLSRCKRDGSIFCNAGYLLSLGKPTDCPLCNGAVVVMMIP